MTVLGAGEVIAPVLSEALTYAPTLVAADGAAGHALALGHIPAAVIGDLDSLDAAARALIPPNRIHEVAEQESTDFDKCLRHIAAPLVIAVGFTGARLDHELAAFGTLLAHAGRPCILLGPDDAAFVLSGYVALDLPLGTRLSLFPFGEASGQATGLRWPVEGIAFAPWGRLGTSNETVSASVTLDFPSGRMLAILPRDHLQAAIRALAPAAVPPAGAPTDASPDG